MSNEDLEKGDSEDSLNFDYNGIEDEVLENEKSNSEKIKYNE